MERNENGLTLGGSGGEVLGATESECGRCGLCGRQLAMVYSPLQAFRMLLDEEDALMAGTLFEELNKPYEGDAK